MVSSMPQLHFTPRKDPVLIVQEAGWAPGLVWMGGKSRPHQDPILDHPAHSQSLYQLSYPGPPQYSYSVLKYSMFFWKSLQIKKLETKTTQCAKTVTLCEHPLTCYSTLHCLIINASSFSKLNGKVILSCASTRDEALMA